MNTVAMSDLSCPALPELLAEPRNESLREHIAGCPRCRVLLAAAAPAAGELEPVAVALSAPALAPRPGLPADTDAAAGMVAIFAADDAEFHLLGLILDREGPRLEIAPIDERVAMATESDFLLDPDLLGYAAMAAISARSEIRIEQLVEVRAELAAESWEWAQRLLAVASGERAEELPAGAPVGVRVLSDLDPRLSYRESRAEFCRPFWLAAEVLGSDRSFGSLVQRRREELGLDSGELAELVEEKGWLACLESGHLDIHARLPVSAAVSLLRSLRIPPLAAVQALLGAAIEATTEDVSQATVLARRRSGSRRRAVAADPEEARRRADVYLGRLREEFQRR